MAELNNTSTGKWSETDASNTSPSPDGWPNGTFPNQVEPIGRSTMGAIKRFWDRINAITSTTGTSNAYIYTPVNTSYPTAYVQGETYSFIANFVNTGAATLNINGLGAKNIFKKGSAGVIALAGGEIQTGDIVMVSYDGSQFQLLSNPSNTTQTTVPTPALGDNSTNIINSAFVQSFISVQGDFKKLLGVWSSNTTTTWTADQLILQNASNQPLFIKSFSQVITVTSSGAGGIDTGSVANSTWYYVWAIYNPTTPATSIIASLSSTAPTLPSGYTYYARIGSFVTDGSAHIIGFRQMGRKGQYIVGSNLANMPNPINGISGNPISGPTWTAVSMTNAVVPATASRVNGTVQYAGSGGYTTLAPNNAYGVPPAISGSNSPPVVNGVGNTAATIPFDFMLESGNIYYASNVNSGGLYILGWEDNL